MLVKFDHLTYAANRASVQSILDALQGKGYQLTLQEEQATNMPTKLAYMQHKDATHGLHFLAPPAVGGIPVEIVSYEHTTKGTSCIDYQIGTQELSIKTSDIESCKTMLTALGCETNADGTISFNGALDEHSLTIRVVESSDISNNLDNEGICCPTIFVRPLSKTKAKLEQAGVNCSEIATFEVQGALFYVFFAQGKGGEILEITSNKL